MFKLVHFTISFSLFLVKGDILSHQQAACKREVKIVAASKTLNPGEFYIFEELKAWLYDAENQNLLEYYDIEDKIRSKSPDDSISRASVILDCSSSENLILQSCEIITRKTGYKFVDKKNMSSWSSQDMDEIRKQNGQTSNTQVEGLIETRGTACVLKSSKSFEFVHNYIRPKQFRHCEGFRGQEDCTFFDTWMIHSPFNIKEPIKEPNSFPEALAFQFDIKQSNQAALFVYDNRIFYSVSENDGRWKTKEVSVQQVFGCRSLQWLIVIIVSLAIVVVPVIVVSIIAFLFVLRQKSKRGKDENSTVATTVKSKISCKAFRSIR